ncbi:MAG TPA: biotin/lipoyl-containing protein, partial [Bryobacteraceae bacterium]|nr:biotin/lipoyl-containing protein [Bryobacteraceae bacterium]
MIDVVMPQMGESIVEGTLTKWLKQPGERVERDEPLFEISTDKVDTEIPSPSAGTLAEVVVQEGQTVAINAVVGRIQDGAGAAAAAAAPARAPAPAPERPAAERPAAAPAPSPAPAPAEAPQAEAPAPPAAAEEMAGPLSPLVRKMAREHNIDLSKIRGTGAGGRITKHDLEAYLASSAGAAPAAAAAPPPPPSRAPQAPAPQAAPPAPAEI